MRFARCACAAMRVHGGDRRWGTEFGAFRAGPSEPDSKLRREHASRAVAPALAPYYPSAMLEPAVTVPPKREASARAVSLIVASAMFMEQLDGTVLATALPTMARSFNADPLHMNVALTSYLLTLAMFIPASGRLADRFGSRTVFRAAIALFTLGSIACAQAPTLAFLVAARMLQGVGGAMMSPVGRLVMLRAVSKTELVKAMAWLMIPATIGPIVGPPVGGFIVTYLSWHWIFYINVPIGIAGIVLVTRYIEEMREPTRTPFDLRGLIARRHRAGIADVRHRDGEPRRRVERDRVGLVGAGCSRRRRSTCCTRGTIRSRCWISA